MIRDYSPLFCVDLSFIVLWQTTGVTHQDNSLSGFYPQFAVWSTQEIPPLTGLFLTWWSWAWHGNFADSSCVSESYLSHDERQPSWRTCQSLVYASASCNYWVRLTRFWSKECSVPEVGQVPGYWYQVLVASQVGKEILGLNSRFNKIGKI